MVSKEVEMTTRRDPGSVVNKIGWYDMLTLDRTTCRVCFNGGSYDEWPKGQIPSMRAIALAEGKPLKGDRIHNRQPYITTLRAALKRHIEREHPGWLHAIRWTKEATS